MMAEFDNICSGVSLVTMHGLAKYDGLDLDEVMTDAELGRDL